MNSWLRSGPSLLVLLGTSLAPASTFVQECDQECFATGDFDGDGRLDAALVNRRIQVKDDLETRYRIAYQSAPGVFTWGRVQVISLSKASGFACGRLLRPDRDALAFAVPDSPEIIVSDAPSPTAEHTMVKVAVDTFGPSALAAIESLGPTSAGLAGLAVGSVFNTPVAHHLELLRRTGTNLASAHDSELQGEVRHVNPIRLARDGAPLLAMMIQGDTRDALSILDLQPTQPIELVRIPDLPRETDFLVALAGTHHEPLLILYTPGKPGLRLQRITQHDDRPALGESVQYDLKHPLKLVSVVGQGREARLAALFGTGETVGLFTLDGTSEPQLIHAFASPAPLIFAGLLPVGDVLLLPLKRPHALYSIAVQTWLPGATSLQPEPPLELPSVDPAIHLIQPRLERGAKSAAYTNTVPGTTATYAMMPIPSGEYLMGTPDAEPGHQSSESPRRRVTIAPFWMQSTEVTWDMYMPFMYEVEEHKLADTLPTDPQADAAADAVTRPSQPYTDMSFGMGRKGYPVIALTQHAASKFCEWLSAKTGHFYRLPTEAEWEYACRAGTQTAYSFGDTPALLTTHGWFEDNAQGQYQKVGRLKPNPWGLYDMHGNVMEWCLDALTDDYQTLTDGALNPWIRPTNPYPHVVRGGSWADPAEDLRSGARRGSDPTWKMTDPQLPKSIYWLSDTKMIGFRLVRPADVPDAETLGRTWNSRTEHD